MEDPGKADVLRRLRSIHGHLGGIIRMTEEDAYCIDLLQQVQAVQGALDKVAGLVLENHLHTCLTTAVRGQDAAERERVLAEVLDVFQAAGRVQRSRPR
jgi:DNA-binding FrmR family transcriptional regulator